MASIFSKESTDSKGNKKSTIEIKLRKSTETFVFSRTTDGLSWLNLFDKFQQYKTLMYMVMSENSRTGIIVFTSSQIKECADLFGVTSKTIRNSISELIKIKALKRLGNNNYKANPAYIYVGGLRKYYPKENEWNPKSKISSKMPLGMND